ncbi:hypothetical protein TYRP_014792 [Tyrophagus putrescentiae]|nr:hypothetical protein TYRP_014792 [Tyrophagus putrescentiae]
MDQLARPPSPQPLPSRELFLPPPPPPPPPPAPPAPASTSTFSGGYSYDPMHRVPFSANIATTSFFSHRLVLVIGDPVAVHHHLVTEHVLGVPYSKDLLPFEDYNDDDHQLARSFQTRCSLREEHTSSSSQREFPLLNEATTRKLLNELLNTQTLVTELEILIAWAPLSTVAESVRLISALGPRLKELTFRCGPLYSDDYSPTLEANHSGQQSSSFSSNSHTRHLITTALELMKLLQVINEPHRLSKVESLTLDLRHDLRLVRPLQLPILGRLRRFAFASKGTSALFLFESLMRFGEPNDRLEEISIGNCTPWSAYLQYFERSPLRERFRQLSYLPHGKVGVPPESTYLHNRFLATFSGLRSFSLSPALIAGLDLTCLGTLLRPLVALEHLNLLLTQELLHRQRPSSSSHRDFVVLPTGVSCSPNLEVLRVNHYTVRARCRFCVPPMSKSLEEEEAEIERLRKEAEEDANNENDDHHHQQQQKKENKNVLSSIIEDIEQHRPCAARLIAPLNACPLLRKVYYYTMPSPKGSDRFLEFTREDF